MKKKKDARPSDAELAILGVLWDRGPSTVREVHDCIGRGRGTGYTTVLKLMQIMAAKGLVQRDESQRSHIYRALLAKGVTQRRLVADLVDRVFGGSGRDLVMQALSCAGLRLASSPRSVHCSTNWRTRTNRSTGMFPIVMPEPVSELIVAVGWALVYFLAQGLLIGVTVAGLMLVLRGRSADLRYGAGCAGLFIMAICPFVTTARGLATGQRGVSPPARAAAVVSSPAGRAADIRHASYPDDGGAIAFSAPAARVAMTRERTVWRHRIENWLPAVVAAWLAGVCLLAVRLVKGLFEVRRLTTQRLVAPPDHVFDAITALADRAGLRRPVRCFLSVLVEVPTVAGWLKPRVLVPMNSLARLTLEQIEALLAHEIAHVRRHDFLVNVLQVDGGVAALLPPGRVVGLAADPD